MGRRKGSKNKKKKQQEVSMVNNMGIVGGDFIDDGVDFIDPNSLNIKQDIIEEEVSVSDEIKPIDGEEIIQKTIEVHSQQIEEIDEGLRNFLSGTTKPIVSPKRSVIEESYQDDYVEPTRSRRPRKRRPIEETTNYGFESSDDLLKQFKNFMLSDIVSDPRFDIEELKYTLEDMLDIVDLFSKQRTRKIKKQRITKGNKYVSRGLAPQVYDAVDDDYYDDDDDIYDDTGYYM